MLEAIMRESPVIREIIAEEVARRVAEEEVPPALRELTLTALHARFGDVPEELTVRLRLVTNETRLKELIAAAVVCPDLEAFRAELRG